MDKMSFREIISYLNYQMMGINFYPHVGNFWNNYKDGKKLFSDICRAIPSNVTRDFVFWTKVIQTNNIEFKNFKKRNKVFSLNNIKKYVDLGDEILSLIESEIEIDNLNDNDKILFNQLCVEILKIKEYHNWKKGGKELFLLDSKLIISNKHLFNSVNNLITSQPETFSFLPEELQKSRVLYINYLKRMKIVGKNSHYHKSTMVVLRNFTDDEEVMSLLIESSSKHFKSGSENIRNNEKVATLAIRRKASNFNFVGDELKNNEDFVLKILGTSGEVYQYLNEQFKEKKIMALTAIKNNSRILNHIKPIFLKDKEVVIEGVSKSGENLKYASLKLRNDKEVANLAVKNSGDAYEFIGSELKSDKDLLLTAIKQVHLLFVEHKLNKSYLDSQIKKFLNHSNLKDDEDLIWLLTKKYKINLFPILGDLKNNEIFVKKYIKEVDIYENIDNKEIALDDEVIKRAIKWKLENIQYIPIKINNRNIKYQNIDNKKFFKAIADNFHKDNEIAIRAIRRFGGSNDLFKELLLAHKDIGMYISYNMKYFKKSMLSEEFIITLLNFTQSNEAYLKIPESFKVKEGILDALIGLDVLNFKIIPKVALENLGFMNKHKNLIVENKDNLPDAYNAIEKLLREEALFEEMNKIEKTEVKIERKKKI